MTIAMHLCRGNFQSTLSLRAAADRSRKSCSIRINVHGYFMEYDSDRAGGFEPLRFVPKAKTIVLGLVDFEIGDGSNQRDETQAPASTTRRNMCRSSSFACRRNAGLRQRKKAISSPRTSNGRSLR